MHFTKDEYGVPEQGYEVAVTHVTSGFQSVMRFQADFARIKGPEPQDLTSFDITLMKDEYTVPQGTVLIPGEQYSLCVVAVDTLGRQFSSLYSDYPIPAERVETTMANFRVADVPSGLVAADKNVVPGQEAYRIKATYRGTEFTRELTFGYDPFISEGPQPDSVSSVEIEGELGTENKILPGAVKKLQVRVTDTAGRSWRLGMEGKGSHAANEYPLPPSRLEVAVVNGSYNHLKREVHFDDNAKGMLGKSYSLNVTYGRDSKWVLRKSYQPDFLNIVPLMMRNKLLMEGLAGPAGQAGSNGRRGQNGRHSTSTEEAGPGSHGGYGIEGMDGKRGDPGAGYRGSCMEGKHC